MPFVLFIVIGVSCC